MRRVAAYDGTTGERLWSTPYLGSLKSTIGMRIGLVHDHGIVVDAGGEARVFKHGDEAPLWTMNLGERLAVVCNGDQGQVVLETVDGRGVALDLAVAAAFAGGLGVGVGSELDGYLARAAALLGGHSREDVLLVAQALASGVLAVGESLAVAECAGEFTGAGGGWSRGCSPGRRRGPGPGPCG